MRSHQPYGYIRVIKYSSEKYNESISIEIKPQQWGCKCQLSIKVVELKFFRMKKIIVRYPSSEFYLYLSEYRKQDAPDTYAHIINIFQTLIDEYIIIVNHLAA